MKALSGALFHLNLPHNLPVNALSLDAGALGLDCSDLAWSPGFRVVSSTASGLASGVLRGFGASGFPQSWPRASCDPPLLRF